MKEEYIRLIGFFGYTILGIILIMIGGLLIPIGIILMFSAVLWLIPKIKSASKEKGK